MLESNTRGLLAEAKFYESYSRWDENLGRYETWSESVERVMNMHRKKYAKKMTPELEEMIQFAEDAYKDKLILGAQRALQFGGDQLMKHNARLYNCVSSYADRPAFFGELFYFLLCGAGAGFSVQKHHVAKLARIKVRKGQAKIHNVTDDIEGWATAVDVLLSSFFVGGGKYPEYEGRRVYFDTSAIREKGAYISGGFKAPGPEPLKKALDLIEHLLNDIVLKGGDTLDPIHVYDICMFIADAVLAGGVRRSATICLFSPDDEDMMNAKTGDWFKHNKQRSRSNNSAVLVRDEVTHEQFMRLMESTKQFGEPGFVFVDDREFTFNPCVEIGKLPVFFHDDGSKESGWQGCNLSEINGGACVDEETFFRACKAASIMGTLQAGYTDFKFLPDITRRIFERESLIGVSVTGWMNNPEVLLDKSRMRAGANIVMDVNEKVASIIGINPAARGTCVKPSGNASVLLQTTSAASAEHSRRFLRNAQMNKEQEVAQLIKEQMPYMVEESEWSDSDYVVSFPVVAPETSWFKNDMTAIDMLKRVADIQENWIEAGTREERCTDKRLRHNVSNTIPVKPDEWNGVAEYIYENRKSYAGVSLISASGDKDYVQAPFTEVLSEEECVKKYGSAALFASGLIVDTFVGFNNLWEATSVASSPNIPKGEAGDKQADWIRRFRKFADNYFEGDLKKAEYCLKDIHLLHRWTKIQQNLTDIDFSVMGQKSFTDIDQMGALACAGGVCEL